jgi:hypothetical protein
MAALALAFALSASVQMPQRLSRALENAAALCGGPAFDVVAGDWGKWVESFAARLEAKSKTPTTRSVTLD